MRILSERQPREGSTGTKSLQEKAPGLGGGGGVGGGGGGCGSLYRTPLRRPSSPMRKIASVPQPDFDAAASGNLGRTASHGCLRQDRPCCGAGASPGAPGSDRVTSPFVGGFAAAAGPGDAAAALGEGSGGDADAASESPSATPTTPAQAPSFTGTGGSPAAEASKRTMRGPERFFYDTSCYTGCARFGGPKVVDKENRPNRPHSLRESRPSRCAAPSALGVRAAGVTSSPAAAATALSPAASAGLSPKLVLPR